MRGTTQVFEAGRYLNITATNTTLKDTGLMGIFVSQASSTPTIKVADGNGTIANTFTPEAGRFYSLPTLVEGTLTITISGTVDATVFHSS
jgi:hypothetical protein